MARHAPPIAAGLCLVGSRLFNSSRVPAVSKQINSVPYRFSATDSCRCHLDSLRTNLGAALSRLVRSALRHVISCRVVSHRCVAMSKHLWPIPLYAHPFRCSAARLRSHLCRGFSPLIYSVAARLKSRLCLAIQWPLDTLRFLSHRFRCLCGRFQAVLFRSFSRRRRSSPCHCISHLYCSFPLLLQ